jgi:hypothetical protein
MPRWLGTTDYGPYGESSSHSERTMSGDSQFLGQSRIRQLITIVLACKVHDPVCVWRTKLELQVTSSRNVKRAVVTVHTNQARAYERVTTRDLLCDILTASSTAPHREHYGLSSKHRCMTALCRGHIFWNTLCYCYRNSLSVHSNCNAHWWTETTTTSYRKN